MYYWHIKMIAVSDWVLYFIENINYQLYMEYFKATK